MRRFPLILVLSLSISRCVRAGDGSVDVGATTLRGVRLACAVVGAIPDKPPAQPDAGTGAEAPSSPAPATAPTPAPELGPVIPPNPFSLMDGGR